jgi:hypothetical protein
MCVSTKEKDTTLAAIKTVQTPLVEILQSPTSSQQSQHGVTPHHKSIRTLTFENSGRIHSIIDRELPVLEGKREAGEAGAVEDEG